MTHDVSIHPAQIAILRELLFTPSATFATLQKSTGLSSDHFNFHISKLLSLGYVRKESRGLYSLTIAGKEHANKLDTDANTIERQPKVAVLLCIRRKSNDDQTEFLMQKRTKQPYYGFWGFPTGKVRWGETIIEAAKRELLEETGLTATCRYIGLYHELVRIKSSVDVIEDKLFHIVACDDIDGILTKDFEGGSNEWKTKPQIEAEPKKYESYHLEMEMIDGLYDTFIEQIVEVEESEF